MFKRKYKFTNKNNAIGGVLSILIAFVSIGLFVWSIWLSFQARGQGGIIVGSIALIALFLAVIGCIIGFLSYRELDKYYTFSFGGSLLNGIMVIILMMLILVGI